MRALVALVGVLAAAPALAGQTEHDQLCELDGSSAQVDYVKDSGCGKKPDASACQGDQTAYLSELQADQAFLTGDSEDQSQAIPAGGWASDNAVGYFQIFELNGDKDALKRKAQSYLQEVSRLGRLEAVYERDCRQAVEEANDSLWGTAGKIAKLGLDKDRWNTDGSAAPQLGQDRADIEKAADNLKRAARG